MPAHFDDARSLAFGATGTGGADRLWDILCSRSPRSMLARHDAPVPLLPGTAMSLHIRHSETADIPAIRDLYAEPSCYAATLQLPHPSLALWEGRLVSPPANFTSLVAVREGRLLGQIGIEVFGAARRRHVANIGMAVSEGARRQGVGRALVQAAKRQCFGWLAVRRIELECYVDNAAALALYRAEGFEIEGTARGYALRDGQYADVHLMACLIEGDPARR